MKKITVLFLALLLIVTCVGCGNSNSSGGSEASGNEVKYKDTITFAQPADAPSLDPQVAKQLRASTVLTNMFETLVTMDENYEIIPCLAESWEWITDTRIEFTLRKDVKFHNGETMTAEDVRYSLQRAVDSSYVGYYFSFVDSVEIVSDDVVAVNLKNPYGATMNTFAALTASIVCKSVASADEEGFTNHPVGTGPYKFVEWKQSESIKLEAFDDYWGGKSPTKYIVMKVVPESTQRAIQLETGEIDLAYEFAPSEISKLEANDDLTYYTCASTKAVTFDVNMRKEAGDPFADQRVRQALIYAIDKQMIVDKLLYGYGAPAANLCTPVVFGFDDSIVANKYDPAKAKELLAEAGYADGFEMTIWTYTEQIYQEVATVVQSMLNEVGITASIETMEYSTMAARMAGGEDYDICLDYFNSITGDCGHTLYGQFNSTSGDNSNWCRLNDPEVDRLITIVRENNDGAVRQEAASQLWKMFDVIVPQFGVYYENVLVGASKNVQNFRVTRDGYHMLRDVVVIDD